MRKELLVPDFGDLPVVPIEKFEGIGKSNLQISFFVNVGGIFLGKDTLDEWWAYLGGKVLPACLREDLENYYEEREGVLYWKGFITNY